MLLLFVQMHVVFNPPAHTCEEPNLLPPNSIAAVLASLRIQPCVSVCVRAYMCCNGYGMVLKHTHLHPPSTLSLSLSPQGPRPHNWDFVTSKQCLDSQCLSSYCKRKLPKIWRMRCNRGPQIACWSCSRRILEAWLKLNRSPFVLPSMNLVDFGSPMPQPAWGPSELSHETPVETSSMDDQEPKWPKMCQTCHLWTNVHTVIVLSIIRVYIMRVCVCVVYGM